MDVRYPPVRIRYLHGCLSMQAGIVRKGVEEALLFFGIFTHTRPPGWMQTGPDMRGMHARLVCCVL
jgi:hypothetical protein